MKRLRDEEVLKARKYAVDKFAKDIIVIADTLEYALKSASNSKLDPREGGNTLKILIDGLEMTYGKLVKVLEEHGVKRIASDGTKFDSDYHMAIYKVPDPSKTPGTILETRKAGYTLNGRVIRAAEVGVVSE